MAKSHVLLYLGVGLIWAFLLLFLVYPLCRIFYDAVTNEAGRFTVAQAPIESELVLITPVSKFIHDASLKAFAEYAKEKWNQMGPPGSIK